MGAIYHGVWNEQPFLTTKQTVVAALANWIVRQLPYRYSEMLIVMLLQFRYNFNSQFDGKFDDKFDFIFETSCEKLVQKIRDTFEQCPNNFTIDLDMLARSVAHSVTLQGKYDQSKGIHPEVT